MPDRQALVTISRIEGMILSIRGQRVMIDADLAEVYGVPTKRLNEQVKRNRERFPEDFMSQLTEKEKGEVVANCDHLKKLKFSHSLPYAFTEHGALMAANVLNSDRAIEASVQVVRVFVKLRDMLLADKDLARKLDDLEKKYDKQFAVVFEAIRQLMQNGPASPKRIGFRIKDDRKTKAKKTHQDTKNLRNRI